MRFAVFPVFALLLCLLVSPVLADTGNDPAPAAPDAADRHLMSHDDMVMVALSLIGTPYRFGGSDPDSGFDCSGLVKYILGLSSTVVVPRSSDEMYRMGGHTITLDELKAGDLIFFRIGKTKRVNHVAVYIGQQRFVHAPSSGNQVRVDKLGDKYWTRYLLGARRVLPENDLPDASPSGESSSPASVMP
ncbi:MAG: C40 family peptidase [bacterium]|nr:C40 family peptidase [bacterium]